MQLQILWDIDDADTLLPLEPEWDEWYGGRQLETAIMPVAPETFSVAYTIKAA
jgi:hypothetical protein